MGALQKDDGSTLKHIGMAIGAMVAVTVVLIVAANIFF